MKAIKYFCLYIFPLTLICSCRPKEQAKHSLGSSTKEYFDVKENSRYIFTDYSDTNVSITYISGNYINKQVNPDIENSEILVYDLDGGAGNPPFTIRCESSGSEFRDRIALLSKIDDQVVIAGIVFNQGGNFTTANGSGDSVFYYPSYTIKDKTFDDVIRIKLNPINLHFKEVFFAKNIGLIARMEKKDNKFFYVKRYSVNK